MNMNASEPVTVAAQLYTLRRFLDQPDKLPDTFRRVREAGYEAAQISGVCAIPAADLRTIMLDAGVKPIGAHLPLARFRGGEWKKTIDDCHAWGVRYVAIPWLDVENYVTMDDWTALFQEFESIAVETAKEGIALQYHNHGFDFSRFGIRDGEGGRPLLEILYETAPTLQSELDFGWLTRSNESPVRWARRMKGRMDQVHLKDWGVVDWQISWRALGEGGVDWPAVVRACLESGTRTFIVEQDECPATNDPFRSLTISRDYLRKILG